MDERDEILEIIWPETGLHTKAVAPKREKDQLGDSDDVELSIDFLTLSLSPLELIQLASFLRMTIDGSARPSSGVSARRGQRLRYSRLIEFLQLSGRSPACHPRTTPRMKRPLPLGRVRLPVAARFP